MLGSFSPDGLEESIMAFDDKATKTAATPVDPRTLNFIDQISYYERLATPDADNDNRGTADRKRDASCFEAWAMPDHIR
jgi:hypothetical protein